LVLASPSRWSRT